LTNTSAGDDRRDIGDELGDGTYPDNPVVYRRWRADHVESQHRGAWALVDSEGEILEGAGSAAQPIFARSSIKGLQAVPLVESGAADRFSMNEVELALSIASHGGEPRHTQPIELLLARLGLGPESLQCGPTEPSAALRSTCSGKHAGFLALALHLGVDPTDYLLPASAGQRAVRLAIGELCGVDGHLLATAVDGCGAPTFYLPLHRLATGVATLCNPGRLQPSTASACRRITAAGAAHADLLSLPQSHVDTQLLGISAGRLFSKTGAEGVQVVGVGGGGLGLAVKVDDGDSRAVQRVTVALLKRLNLLRDEEWARLESSWPACLYNLAGHEVGHHEVLPPHSVRSRGASR